MNTTAAGDTRTRRASKPRTALDARSRGWTLAAAAACLLPLLLQLPTAIALVIGGLGILVAAIAWRLRLPPWMRLALALALAGYVLAASRFAIGRDTGCALLAAMLAIKPMELSSPRDARSLLGFALFAPFSTFLLDQGPLSLLLGAAAMVLSLAAMQRLAETETAALPQASPDAAGDALPPARRLASILRLAAIGLPLALAAFWLFPRIPAPMWGVPERALARPGLSDRMTPGEWIDLLADDTPALRATFHGPAPPPSQMYWRGPVLWDFDGRSWTQPQWLRGLPPAPVRRSGPTWDYEMAFEPTDRRQLVALELPLQAPGGTSLGGDYGLYAARPLGALTHWRLRASAPASFEPELNPLLRRLALRLPDGYNPRTLALAQQWRREAGANDSALVRRALSWFHRDFVYTLDTPLPGRDSVDEFLFVRKAGFCEHFSSAFVVLMRAAGIPARVVTGYAGGYHNRYGDYWLVRRMDAHAWAEAWLPGRGWTRVDPTAAVAPERVHDTLQDRLGDGFGARLRPVLDLGDWARRGWNDFVLGFDAARQHRMLRPLGIDALGDGTLIALFAAAAGLALAWMLWLAARNERETDPVLRAWHCLGRRYARLGLGRAPHEAAGDWAARVAAARPPERRPASAGLVALSRRFADWRYAAGDKSGREQRALARALRQHRP